jgi:hypothetical protein
MAEAARREWEAARRDSEAARRDSEAARRDSEAARREWEALAAFTAQMSQRARGRGGPARLGV